MTLKKIISEWEGIPCPPKKDKPMFVHNVTFSIEGTIEQRNDLERLLRKYYKKILDIQKHNVRS